VVISRGNICWIDLGQIRGSRPAKRGPVLVISSDSYNSSKLTTALVAVLTSNLALAGLPGNVLLPAADSGLPRDSAVNITAVVTVDKSDLDQPVGALPAALMSEVDRRLRLALSL
jgi:mRNA interferase MazF